MFIRHDYFKDHRKIWNLTIISFFSDFFKKENMFFIWEFTHYTLYVHHVALWCLQFRHGLKWQKLLITSKWNSVSHSVCWQRRCPSFIWHISSDYLVILISKIPLEQQQQCVCVWYKKRGMSERLQDKTELGPSGGSLLCTETCGPFTHTAPGQHRHLLLIMNLIHYKQNSSGF